MKWSQYNMEDKPGPPRTARERQDELSITPDLECVRGGGVADSYTSAGKTLMERVAPCFAW